jgi:hypothetical protein
MAPDGSREYRISVLGEPRGPWRPTRERVMRDAVWLGLAVQVDIDRRHHAERLADDQGK